MAQNPKQQIYEWLKTFEHHVNTRNFDAAQALFHPKCYCFGSKATSVHTLEDLVAMQWKMIWPNIKDFRFDFSLIKCHICQSRDLATAICPWHSRGFHKDGRSYLRAGRVTIIFIKNPGQSTWKAYHTHYSLNPGTPQITVIKKKKSSAR